MELKLRVGQHLELRGPGAVFDVIVRGIGDGEVTLEVDPPDYSVKTEEKGGVMIRTPTVEEAARAGYNTLYNK